MFSGILLRICWRGITASQVILRSGTIPWKITTSNVIQISTINTALFNKTSAQCSIEWYLSIIIFLKETDLSYFLVLITTKFLKNTNHAISPMEGHSMGGLNFSFFVAYEKTNFSLITHYPPRH